MNRQKWIGITVITITIIGTVSVILIVTVNRNPIISNVAVIIDAGSTHFQVYLYNWTKSLDSDDLEITLAASCGHPYSLTDFSSTIGHTNLIKCLQSIRSTAHSSSLIGSTSYSRLETYFAGTGGLRLSSLSNPQETDQLLIRLQSDLTREGFYPVSVSILSGEKEGLFAWLALRYLLSVNGNENILPWFGIIELGGTSSQITFQVAPGDHNEEAILKDERYYLYSVSNLCFGITEAERRYRCLLAERSRWPSKINDPCLFEGLSITVNGSYFSKSNWCIRPRPLEYELSYDLSPSRRVTFIGSGNSSECYKLIAQSMDTKLCQSKFDLCPEQLMVKLPRGVRLFGLAGYFYPFNELELGLELSSSNLRRQSEWVCSKSWLNLSKRRKFDSYYWRQYCFTLNLISWKLSSFYQLDEPTIADIEISNRLEQISVGWTLGYLINIISERKSQATSFNYSPFSAIIFVLAFLMVIIVLVITIIFLTPNKDINN